MIESERAPRFGCVECTDALRRGGSVIVRLFGCTSTTMGRALSLAFPSSVAEDAVDCAALARLLPSAARLARATQEDLSEEPEVMAFDDESMSFQPQSPGQALDEETAQGRWRRSRSRRSRR